jgi:hypothetical protein
MVAPMTAPDEPESDELERLCLINWESQPVVLRNDLYEAFSVQQAGGPWKKVDYYEAAMKGAVVSEAWWHKWFGHGYDISKIPWSAPRRRRPKGQLEFFFWNACPAVVKDAEAFAVTAPGGEWQRVDRADVCYNGLARPVGELRASFDKRLGPLDFSKIPWSQPSSPEGAE